MIEKVIKIMRKEKGLTQKKLGKLLNLSDTTISAYELGKIHPEFETILRIFKICGYDLKILDKENQIIDIEDFIRKNE